MLDWLKDYEGSTIHGRGVVDNFRLVTNGSVGLLDGNR